MCKDSAIKFISRLLELDYCKWVLSVLIVGIK